MAQKDEWAEGAWGQGTAWVTSLQLHQPHQAARQHIPARCFTFWEEGRRGSEVKVTSDA